MCPKTKVNFFGRGKHLKSNANQDLLNAPTLYDRPGLLWQCFRKSASSSSSSFDGNFRFSLEGISRTKKNCLASIGLSSPVTWSPCGSCAKTTFPVVFGSEVHYNMFMPHGPVGPWVYEKQSFLFQTCPSGGRDEFFSAASNIRRHLQKKTPTVNLQPVVHR